MKIRRRWILGSLLLGAAAHIGLEALRPIPDVEPTRFDREAQAPAEGQRWAIRYGAEPIDLHIAETWFGINKRTIEKMFRLAAGPGRIFNHNYIEFGTLDAQENFESRKRIHGIGLDRNWQMTGSGRLVGFVVDGTHTTFEDDPIQRNDPHETRRNQLQHALANDTLGRPYSRIVFTTENEEEILKIYSAAVQATIDFNNRSERATRFGLFGQWAPNSNSFNSFMQDIVYRAGPRTGFRVGEHDAPGSDIGHDYDINNVLIKIPENMSLPELRLHVQTLEQQAATKLRQIRADHTRGNAPTPAPGQ